MNEKEILTGLGKAKPSQSHPVECCKMDNNDLKILFHAFHSLGATSFQKLTDAEYNQWLN